MDFSGPPESDPRHTATCLGLSSLSAQGGLRGPTERALGFVLWWRLETDNRPAALDGFVPSKDRFLQIAARKGVMVSNGYHGYR